MSNTYDPTDDVDAEIDPVQLEREDAALREGRSVAIKSAALWAPLSGAVLILAYYLSRSTFQAADHIFLDAGTEWDQAIWPAALYGVFGLAFGALIGWRITGASGLVGNSAWLIGAASVAAVCLIGIVGALFIHEKSLPILIWISSAVMIVCSLGSITYYTKWNP